MHDLSAVARDYATKVLDEVKELTGLISEKDGTSDKW